MNLDLHKNHRLLFTTAWLGFLGLSVLVAVAPALRVEEVIGPTPGSQPLTGDERAGLDLYVAEGCPYCHTQQVRPLAQDKQFGRPSVPGDYARLSGADMWRGTPEILGSERTGPDLSDIGRRQPSATWQYMHLYQPRALVPASVMPAFSWLFRVKAKADSSDVVVPVPAQFAPASGVVTATPEAERLVLYLLGLKQASVGAATPAAGAAPAAGEDLYRARCAGCHQANGAGVAGAFPPLAGDLVVTNPDPGLHIRIVLYGMQGEAIRGVTYPGAMPAWADQLTDAEVAAAINYERKSWGNDAPPIALTDVARARREHARSQ